MGLLTRGHPLSWGETVPLLDYIKEHGIQQFINLYHKLRERQDDCLRWGDEVEYILVKFDDDERKVRVCMRGEELLARLQATNEVNALVGNENSSLWVPEYGAYMIEGVPGVPYGGLLACVNVVENNMRRRRAEVARLLKPDESIMTMCNFPRLGCADFTWPPSTPTPRDAAAASRSLFFPDAAIFSGHPRYLNLTRNIRHRRGEKVCLNVPIFRDENTLDPFTEDFESMGDDGEAARVALPNHVYLDAMGLGMGASCLQVTFQAVNVSEARWLYDQLMPITPVLLALSAASPVFRGYLCDVDCRWNMVDDRTVEERKRVKKSRYDSAECYIYPCSAGYNDLALEYDERRYQQLLDGGIDEYLAKHIAHMFMRDPLQVYKERVEQDDATSTEHFDTIQACNWMNMRFKPPPADTPAIGWRVEFRPIEVQLTDFENAAYVCFVVLLTRVLISFRLTFIMPISLVGENMQRAQARDAVLSQRFFFRKGVGACRTPPDDAENVSCQVAPSEEIIEMSIAEIINGKGDEFPGLIALIRQYLDSADVDVDTRCTVSQYLNFMQKRATGEICTMAHWMRDFVRSHAEYKKDSVVSDSICYDLVKEMDSIAKGVKHCEKLLGDFRSKTDKGIPNAVRRAEEAMTVNRIAKK